MISAAQTESERKITLVGLGNCLLRDEGIGVAVVEQLKRSSEIPPNVEVVEYGTAGMAVVHVMANRDKVIFIDCTFMGEEPGIIRRFTPDGVESGKKMSGWSQHEGDLLQAISLSRYIGEHPDEIVIFGVEPETTEPGEELSPTLQGRLAEYVDVVMAEVRDYSDA